MARLVTVTSGRTAAACFGRWVGGEAGFSDSRDHVFLAFYPCGHSPFFFPFSFRCSGAMAGNDRGGPYGVSGGVGGGVARNLSGAGRAPGDGGDVGDGGGGGDGRGGAAGGYGGAAGGDGDDHGSDHGRRNSGDSDQVMGGGEEVDELYVGAEDPDSVSNLVANIHEMLDYVKKKPLLLGGSASFMRDHLRTLLASNAAAADVAASVRDARLTRVRAALASALYASEYPTGNPPPHPPRSPGSDPETAMDVFGGDANAGPYTGAAAAHPYPPGYEVGGGAVEYPAVAGSDGTPGAGPMDDQYHGAVEAGLASPPYSDAAAAEARAPGVGDAGSLFASLPDALAQTVFSFLDGPELSRMHGVCRRWRELASDAHLWKALTLRHWRALEHDEHVWKFVDASLEDGDDQKWRLVYPTVSTRARWTCRLQKTGKFICNLVAHHIAGATLGDDGLPSVLVVERRFNIHHLKNFVVPNASVLYFEPETDADAAGFHDFIEYLIKRTRAGLALEEQPPQRRFIFIPPCEFSTELGYAGPSLLGVVQVAYPPINP